MTSEKDPMSRGSLAITPTLGDVVTSLATREDLSETRRRDLRSAVKRVAALLGDAPERIPLVMPSISTRLAKLSAAAAGVSPKTFHNLRSDFLAAVKASGLHSARRSARVPLSPEWQALLQELSTRRAHLGLSRFARYACERGVEPSGVDDSTIEAFIATVRTETLHRKPNDLHRKVAQIWNEAAEFLHACPAAGAGSFLQTPPATRGLVDALRFLPGRCRALFRVVRRDRHVRNRCPAACHGAANGSAAS